MYYYIVSALGAETGLMIVVFFIFVGCGQHSVVMYSVVSTLYCTGLLYNVHHFAVYSLLYNVCLYGVRTIVHVLTLLSQYTTNFHEGCQWVYQNFNSEKGKIRVRSPK